MQQPRRPAASKADHVDAESAEAGAMFKPSHAAGQGGGSASVWLTSEAVRALMWQSAGLFRSRNGLIEVVTALEGAYRIGRPELESRPLDASVWRSFNLLTVACLIARAALRREESRGGHFRQDFPERDDPRWRIHVTEACAPIHVGNSS
jgi:succinate dehydrogenase/fumarate reductase flavoprotein subunit